MSHAWEALLGWSAAELFALPFITLVHSDDVEAVVAALLGTYATQHPADFECRYRCKGGAYLRLRWQVRLEVEPPQLRLEAWEIDHAR